MDEIISIITPSLNQGKFIEQTIQSVLRQSGDFFIDYIIADGGSKDDSVKVIRKFEELLDKKKIQINCRGVELRWWSRPDNGQAQAINQGFKIAKGRIMAWINSDDYYEDGAFTKIINKFKEIQDADLVYGDGFVVNELAHVKYLQKSRQGNFDELLRRGCFIFQPSAFISKQALNRVGMLNETYHYVMDYDLWLRLGQDGRLLYIPETLSTFRIWEKSKTKSDKKKFKLERRILNKVYGGNMIDYGSIEDIRSKLLFLDYFKKKLPGIYSIFKKIFYRIIDTMQYRKK